MDCRRSLGVYELLRKFAPPNPAKTPQYHPRLIDILGQFDALFLDGYGVLNMGAEATAEAPQLLEEAATRGIEVIVLTNGANTPNHIRAERYQRLGLAVDGGQIVSSRDAFLAGVAAAGADTPPSPIGVIDGSCTAPDDGRFVLLDNATPQDWLDMAAIGFLGATAWDMAWQTCLEAAMAAGVPIHVANCDVSAPTQNGFSYEPGYWVAAAIVHIPHAKTHWYGKPHRAIFDLALRRLTASTGRDSWDLGRIAMVGDSLHTDILGGNAVGVQSVLVTDYGLFRDGTAERAMEMSRIAPDFIVKTL